VAKKQTWAKVIAGELAAVKSGAGDLRKFGITMGVAFAVLGGLLLWRGHWQPKYFFWVAGAFLVLGLAAPVVLGWVMTRVILVVLFYVGITPIALIARLVGKRFLDLGFEPARASYWIPRPAADRGRERYKSQF